MEQKLCMLYDVIDEVLKRAAHLNKCEVGISLTVIFRHIRIIRSS